MAHLRNPGVKRLMKEAQELHEPTEEYYAQPLEDNLFEWHFTVRGPYDTEFQDGIYHGRIILPNEYPLKPPNFIFMTHNGRFEVNKKVCLSISTHHPESWQPSWSIRTAILAIVGFMPSKGLGNIGSLDYTPEERKKMALLSTKFSCHTCGPIASMLKERTSVNAAKIRKETEEIANEVSLSEKKDGDKEKDAPKSEATEKSSSPADRNQSGEISPKSPTSNDTRKTELNAPKTNSPQSEQNVQSRTSSVQDIPPQSNVPSAANPVQNVYVRPNSSTQRTATHYTALHSGMLCSSILLFAFLLFRRFYLLGDDVLNMNEEL